jgi:protein O-GlcNAc transferase
MAFSVDQALRKAKSQAQKGALAEAEQLYRSVLEKFPNNKRAQQGLKNLGSSANPASGQDDINSMIALYNQGDLQGALAKALPLSAQHPESIDILHFLGTVHAQMENFEEAENCFQKVVRANPQFAEAHNFHGNTLQSLGQNEKAIAAYETAIQIEPDYADAYYNLAIALQALGHYEEAIRNYTKTTQLQPDHADAYNNLGNTYQDLGRHAEAITFYQNALKIEPPTVVEIHVNLGNSFADLGRRDEAIAQYSKALEIDPLHANALAEKYYQQAHICDWENFSEKKKIIEKLGLTGEIVPPFTVLAHEDAPARHRQRSERYAKSKFDLVTPASVVPPSQKPDRLRIGYFSADFRMHAVSLLLAQVFELHDREKFSLHGYSLGPQHDDEMRDRLSKTFDFFHDVQLENDANIAALARQDGIDIAIDLSGYTKHSRSGIFAHRAAPIQISYLGYPGTMGAEFIDYIIADEDLIPISSAQFYTEKPIYLPHQYQAQDNTIPISKTVPTRTELNLPEDGFVFCSFNNNFKITPDEFDVWARLLQEIDGSVLWLLKSNDWSEENLRQEIKIRGVNPARLVFAGNTSMPDYLARLQQADLFLDSFNYNAGATASNALWAGLPILTKAGNGYTARMAASLLLAIDLPELITHSIEQYEFLALDLARDKSKLRAIKNKLEANRDTTPLFNTALFTRNLENAYLQAFDRFQAGQRPDIIHVHPQN